MKNNSISKLSKVKNLFYLPGSNDLRTQAMQGNLHNSILHKEHGGSTDQDRNLNMYLAPVNKPRMMLDLILWREALRLAEDQILPQRYLMQLCYMDTVLDAHTRACLERRENLTLLRKFVICDADGNVSDKWTKFFDKPWLRKIVKYILEAKWYGYSLITLGDIEDGDFSKITIIPRTNISPDRMCVVSVPNAPLGARWDEEPYKDSHLWINTPDQHGLTECGYGLLYELTLLTIGLRNNLNFNMQFTELFGMPFRYVKTDKYDKPNLDYLESALQNMGSLGYAIIRKDEEICFEDTSKGAGFESYADLEERLEKKVSKIILGHSDALDPTHGKLGSQQGENSPQQQALNDIQASDGEFIKDIINSKLLNFLRINGISLPKSFHFEYLNDSEDQENEKYRNEQNYKIAQTIQALSLAGIVVEPTNELQIQMGLKLTKNENENKTNI